MQMRCIILARTTILLISISRHYIDEQNITICRYASIYLYAALIKTIGFSARSARFISRFALLNRWRFYSRYDIPLRRLWAIYYAYFSANATYHYRRKRAWRSTKCAHHERYRRRFEFDSPFRRLAIEYNFDTRERRYILKH
jgi:hypothetical protein